MKMIVILAVMVAASAAARYEPQQQSYYKPDYYPEVPAQYGFAYDVKDAYSNVDLGHQENRNGDDVKGNYNVLLPDGRRQVVNYYVNGYSGFVADVEFQGEAKYPEAYPAAYPKPTPSYPKPAYEPSYPKPAYEPAYPKSSYPRYEPSYPAKAYEPSYPASYKQPAYEPVYPTYPSTYEPVSYAAYPAKKPAYEPSYPSKPSAYEPAAYKPAYKPSTYATTPKAYPTTEAYVPAYPEPKQYPSSTYRPNYEPKRAAQHHPEVMPKTEVMLHAVEEAEPVAMDEASISKTMSKPLFRDEAEAMVKSESTSSSSSH